MEFKEALYTRRSIRSYTGDPIPQDVLDDIFAGAMMAPSWKNTQTAGYVVAVSDEMKDKVRSALPSFNAASSSAAGALVVMTAKVGRAGFERDGSYSTPKEDRWQNFDAGVACQTLCLSAWDHGIGTLIMGLFDEAALREILALPEDRIVTAVVAMGYPAVSPQAPKRKSVSDQVAYI